MLEVPSYSQHGVVTPQLMKDLQASRWQVRQNAFERLLATSNFSIEQPQIRTLLVQLRETENAAASKSEPDLFEDDDYLAYDEKLTSLVQSIVLETHERRAWDALVHMRYNPESEYGKWFGTHQEALASLEELLHSPYEARRINAVYSISEILARSKTSHSLSSAEYRRLKRLVLWHAEHDVAMVSNYAIVGIGLTCDSEDLPFLEHLAPTIKEEWRIKSIQGAEQNIREAEAMVSHPKN